MRSMDIPTTTQGVEEAIINLLTERMPKMFYTSHYDRMSGKISVNELDRNISNNDISPDDQIFLDFLEYAGTSLEDLKDTSQSEELKAKCQGASNDIRTDEIFQFWSLWRFVTKPLQWINRFV